MDYGGMAVVSDSLENGYNKDFDTYLTSKCSKLASQVYHELLKIYDEAVSKFNFPPLTDVHDGNLGIKK